MRQADIEAGMVLYWNDNNDWERDHGYGRRVVVQEGGVGHWYMGTDKQFHDHGSRVRNPYGTWTVHGVVVEVQEGVGRTRKDVAPIRQLRGHYDECMARVQAYRDGRAEAQRKAAEEADRQDRERAVRMARGRAALSRLEAWGIQRGRDASLTEDMVAIRADVLEALMDALPLNWQYEE